MNVERILGAFMANNKANEDNEFKIVSGEKDNTVIILFLGQIRSQEVPELESLLNVLAEKSQPTIIFSFRDVTQLLPGAHSTLAKMQATLRKAGKLLALCSIKPEIKTALLQAGVLRESEIFNNIPEGWQALKVRLREAQVRDVEPEKKAA